MQQKLSFAAARRPGAISLLLFLLGAAALAGLSACATSQETTIGGKPDVFIANGDGGEISRCRNRIAAVAISESDSNAQALSSAGLPRSMAPLVRQLLMQTRCFAVVDRSSTFAALENEVKIREQQGQARAAQMAAMTPADYLIRAEIVFVEQTDGRKGTIGALFGNVIGGLSPEMRKREALVMLSAVDTRTSEIVASSFGRGTSETSTMGGLVLGGGLIAIEGGWLDTPQAKPVAAALVDSWNQLLPRLVAAHEKNAAAAAAARKDKPQAASAAQQAASAALPAASAPATAASAPAAPAAPVQPASEAAMAITITPLPPLQLASAPEPAASAVVPPVASAASAPR